MMLVYLLYQHDISSFACLPTFMGNLLNLNNSLSSFVLADNFLYRRGEEHSFILKPTTSQWKSSNSTIEKGSRSSNLAAGNSASAWRHSSFSDGKHGGDQYTVLVSCRCNYTGINYCKLAFFIHSCRVES